MQVSFVSFPSDHAANHACPRRSRPSLRFAHDARSAWVRPDEEWQRYYRQAATALDDARVRAERAEQRLRSRLAELAWPAALGGIVAGFAAVFALRVAGL